MKRSSFKAVIKAIENFENQYTCLSIKNAKIECKDCKGHGSIDLYSYKGEFLGLRDCKKCNGHGEIETDESSESYFSHSGCSICNIPENESGGAGNVFDVTYLAREDIENKNFENVYDDQICGSCLSIIVNGDQSGLDFSVTEEDVILKNPKLILLDVCLPDYFRGHSNMVFCAFVDGKTTVRQVIEMIDDDASSQEITSEFCGFTYDDLERAIDRFKTENKENMENICFPDLSEVENDEDDQIESIIAYFTVINED